MPNDLLVENHTGYYRFTWNEPGVQVKVSRLREKDNATTAELLFVKLSQDMGEPQDVYRARVNLLVPRSMKELANAAATAFVPFSVNGFNWVSALNLVAHDSVNFWRIGEPVEVVSSQDVPQRVDYLAFPFVPKHHPTILFGLGGTGKSIIALALGIIIQSGHRHNKLGITCNEQCNVLYLDWESYKSDFHWRLYSLCRGLGLPKVRMAYRRGVEFLDNDIEVLQEMVHDNGIGLVIVDSIGAACGGDLNGSERAISFLNALRSLGVTSLSIGHAPKDNEDRKYHSVTGHAYFTNLGRLLWEVESAYEDIDEDGTITVALTNTKTNIDKRHKPRAYSIAIDNAKDIISIKQVDIADTIFNTKLPLGVRIIRELRAGPLSTNDLAERLGNRLASVNTTVHAMRRKGKLVALGGRDNRMWGISAEAIDDNITPAMFDLEADSLWKGGNV